MENQLIRTNGKKKEKTNFELCRNVFGQSKCWQRFYSTKGSNKRLETFPSPAGKPLNKLSLAGNNLITPDQGEFGRENR